MPIALSLCMRLARLGSTSIGYRLELVNVIPQALLRMEYKKNRGLRVQKPHTSFLYPLRSDPRTVAILLASAMV